MLDTHVSSCAEIIWTWRAPNDKNRAVIAGVSMPMERNMYTNEILITCWIIADFVRLNELLNYFSLQFIFKPATDGARERIKKSEEWPVWFCQWWWFALNFFFVSHCSIFQLWMAFQIRWEFSTRVLILLAYFVCWIRIAHKLLLLLCVSKKILYVKKIDIRNWGIRVFRSNVCSLLSLPLSISRWFPTCAKECDDIANFSASDERKISILHLIALFGSIPNCVHKYDGEKETASRSLGQRGREREPGWLRTIHVKRQSEWSWRKSKIQIVHFIHALWHSNWILVNWIILCRSMADMFVHVLICCHPDCRNAYTLCNCVCTAIIQYLSHCVSDQAGGDEREHHYNDGKKSNRNRRTCTCTSL